MEVSPNIGFFWQSGHQISVGYESIIKERAIICICYKWENQNKVYSLTWDKNQNDKKLISDFLKVANQATELIAHNGDRFDIKWIRTQALKHGLLWHPHINTIDTLKIARNSFKFNSNRLDYLGKLLLEKGKTDTGYDLWKNICLKNCKTSLNKMVKYCKNDVILLEQVFAKLRPYTKPKLSYAADRGNCVECNSDYLVVNRTVWLPSGNRKVQFICKDCGTSQTKTVIEKKK